MNLHRFENKGLSFEDKTILLRTDLNIDENLQSHPKLIELTRTFDMLLQQKARIICIAHKGRPHSPPTGKEKKELTLLPFVHILEKKKYSIAFASPEKFLFPADKQIILCENMRFFEKNIEQISLQLRKKTTHFIHDAFSVIHRKEFCSHRLPLLYPSTARYAGPLFAKEYDAVHAFRHAKKKEYLLALGGNKADKLFYAQKTFSLPPHQKPNFVLIGGALSKFFLEGREEKITSFIKESEGKNISLFLLYEGKIFFWQNQSFSVLSLEEWEKILREIEAIFWNGPLENSSPSPAANFLLSRLSSVEHLLVAGSSTSRFVSDRKIIALHSHQKVLAGGAALAFVSCKTPGNDFPLLKALSEI